MDKKTLKIIVIFIVIVFIAVATIEFMINMMNVNNNCHKTCFNGVCVEGVCRYRINESKAREIVDERYPDSEKEARFDPDCGEYGCWNVSIGMNESGVGGAERKIVIDSVSGNIIDEIIYCDPIFAETFDNGTKRIEEWYYNSGCNNPKPTCDIVDGICRTCRSSHDCMKRRITFIFSGDYISSEYDYEAISGRVVGHYNGTNRICTIYKDGSKIYSEPLPYLDKCEKLFLSYIRCEGGQCK